MKRRSGLLANVSPRAVARGMGWGWALSFSEYNDGIEVLRFNMGL